MQSLSKLRLIDCLCLQRVASIKFDVLIPVTVATANNTFLPSKGGSLTDLTTMVVIIIRLTFDGGRTEIIVELWMITEIKSIARHTRWANSVHVLTGFPFHLKC